MLTLCMLLSLVGQGYCASALNFLSIGEWGSVSKEQSRVASEMEKIASNVSLDFIISVGDNFYEDGVSGVDDPQWETTFREVYLKKSLKDVPWLAVLGNHDYHQNAEAQIDFARDNSVWNMDAHYYTRQFVFGEDNCKAKFIFLDTIWFDPSVSKSTKKKVADPEAE